MPCVEDCTPSKASLKFSFSNRMKEYPRIAALHGIAYVVAPTRPKIERLAWFLCFLVSTFATLVIIFILLERFRTDPMLNTVEVRMNNDQLDFPRVFLCPPLKSINNTRGPEEKYYKRLYLWDLRRIRLGYNMTPPDSLDMTMTLKKYFIENVTPCAEFIGNPKLAGIELDCADFEAVFTSRGICYSVPSTGVTVQNEPVNFSFNITSYPVWVYISTQPNEKNFLRHLEFHLFQFPMFLLVKFQETNTSPTAKILTRSQRQCFFPGEQTDYVKCMLDCEVANSLKYCDCVVWYLAIDESVAECPVNRYECLYENAAKIVDTSKCPCLLPCNQFTLLKSNINLRWPHEASEIKISKKAMITYKRSVRFGWFDLLVSFGGIAGLFMGCSLLSLIEFGYYFSLRTYCGAVLNKPKRRYNLTKINVLDAPQPVTITNTRRRPTFPKDTVTFHDYIN